MKRLHFDPDVTRRDDAPYWAAVLAVAIRNGDTKRAEYAERELARLGIPLARVHNPEKEVDRAS